jgi:ribonuclease HI
LSEFELKFESAKAVKGQIIADFITEHRDPSINLLEITPWALLFDGSSCGKGGGVGILLISPRGEMFKFAIPIQPVVTNNQAEYEEAKASIWRFQLKEAKAISIDIYGDSELVIKQLNGQYECRNDILKNYYEECKEILKSFQLVILQHIPREHNEEANRLAQSASGYRENQEVFANDVCTFGSDLAEDDWTKEIVDYLENPSQKVSRKLRYKAIKFVLLDGHLYYKSLDGVFLQCLGQEEAKRMMSEVHDGLCGAHQSAYRMKWVIRHTGCYWPTMLEDCFEYYKGCQDCQRFGNIQRVLSSTLNPIIKPWPFRGWGIDLIGQINPPSSKEHKFVLLVTDYFTKWVEEIPLKRVTLENIVEFVKEHIIYRFGIPQTITTDQGTQFTSSEFREFAESMGIKLLNSSPYYAQANGQAEASNKIMIKIIQKKNDQKPWEMQSDSRRVVLQKDLSSKVYSDLMMDELEDLHTIRLRALENIEKNKMRVAKYYNKKVKVKQFAEEDLVWKVLLPIGTKYSTFGKWSPNWEGAFRVVRCTPGNVYILKTLLGEEFTAVINGRYLKKYCRSVEVDR